MYNIRRINIIVRDSQVFLWSKEDVGLLFNSYIFVLFFLPLTLLLYFGANRLGKERLAQIILIVFSLYFYSYFHLNYLLIIVASVLFNYACSRIIKRKRQNGCVKWITAFGILANVSVIFYFKYFNFFLENINCIFSVSLPLKEILMPLGISFFTFQQISYLVDSYKGETGEYSFVEYALFVVFFPQLIAGPIVLHQEMIPQFRDPKRKVFNQDKMAKGIWWLAIGLAKKVLIADTLGKGVDWGYASPQLLGSFDTILLSFMYTLQIYFDFSGYCDMASGVASMFGFELPRNFNSPYKATSINDFWDRWHMSLSRFLQKYIYIPLGGNRKGLTRTLLNIMIVFLISGIWHGAAWTFIAWGLIHGLASVIHRLIAPGWKRIPKVLTWFMTFLFINFTWIFFRAGDFEQVKVLFSNLLKPFRFSIAQGLQEQFHYLEFTYLADHISFLGDLFGKYPGLPMWIVFSVALFIALIPRNCQEKRYSPTVINAIYSVILLVWSIMSFSGISIFLYFNF